MEIIWSSYRMFVTVYSYEERAMFPELPEVNCWKNVEAERLAPHQYQEPCGQRSQLKWTHAQRSQGVFNHQYSRGNKFSNGRSLNGVKGTYGHRVLRSPDKQSCIILEKWRTRKYLKPKRHHYSKWADLARENEVEAFSDHLMWSRSWTTAQGLSSVYNPLMQ